MKTSSLLADPSTDHLGLTNQVPPHEVVAMSGIYVDDYLTVGPPSVVESFMLTLRKKWKTSDPQYLTLDHELTFLGVTLRLTAEGILLHQKLYTEDLLQEHSPHITARRRTTSGDWSTSRRMLLYHLILTILNIRNGSREAKEFSVGFSGCRPGLALT